MSEPEEDPYKELNKDHVDPFLKYLAQIKYGKIKGSCQIALATITLLEKFIQEAGDTDVLELCESFRAIGRQLEATLPDEQAASNTVRRVLRALRDEARALANQNLEGVAESLQHLVLAEEAPLASPAPAVSRLQEPLKGRIAELRMEVEGAKASISAQAAQHLHADDTVLTYEASAVVEQFLLADPARAPRLVLVQGTRVQESHAMVARLVAADVHVTLVPAVNLFAVMSRVTKVIVGVRAALAGGSLLGPPGLELVALAAEHHSVPVIALAPLYKLTPVYPNDEEYYNQLQPPFDMAPYDVGTSDDIPVISPKYDLVDPGQVALLVTNNGGISPNYIYRQLSEIYDRVDYRF